MTLTDKIKNGILKRATVESVLADQKQKLADLKSEWNNKTGFSRDQVGAKMAAINQTIAQGERILKTMKEMGV